MTVSRPLLAACLMLAIATSLPAQDNNPRSTPNQEKFEKMFGGKEVMEMVRNARRVEAMRIELDRSDPEKTDATKLIQKGKPFDVPEKEAALFKTLFTDRNSCYYFEGGLGCEFDPGVKLIFHNADGGEVSLVICLGCSFVSIQHGGKQVGFANFGYARDKILALAAETFPKDKGIRKMADSFAESAKEYDERMGLWRSGMPASIRPLWGANELDPIPDTAALKAAFEKEFPDPHKRILALLEWYGSVSPSELGSYGYEDIPGDILMEFSTPDLVAAAQSVTLDERQARGAARLFWDFPQKRPDDVAKIPDSLNKMLIERYQKSKNVHKAGEKKSTPAQ